MHYIPEGRKPSRPGDTGSNWHRLAELVLDTLIESPLKQLLGSGTLEVLRRVRGFQLGRANDVSHRGGYVVREVVGLRHNPHQWDVNIGNLLHLHENASQVQSLLNGRIAEALDAACLALRPRLNAIDHENSSREFAQLEAIAQRAIATLPDVLRRVGLTGDAEVAEQLASNGHEVITLANRGFTASWDAAEGIVALDRRAGPGDPVVATTPPVANAEFHLNRDRKPDPAGVNFGL